jgi:hypothetical protein
LRDGDICSFRASPEAFRPRIRQLPIRNPQVRLHCALRLQVHQVSNELYVLALIQQPVGAGTNERPSRLERERASWNKTSNRLVEQKRDSQ